MRAVVTGKSDTHLCTADEAKLLGARVHRDAVSPFLELRAAARLAGFDVTLASGHRNYERQLSIWNRKIAGDLAVLDSNGDPIDIDTLTPRALVFAILRWSALPGASRHHWGSDMDVYDAANTPLDYQVQLIPAEVDPGGMHAALHAWLDDNIAAGTSFGFYRPYDADRGGVAPERWHLSYAPLALEFARYLTRDVLSATVADGDMLLKEIVLAELDEIYERFVVNVSTPPFSVTSA